MSEQQMAFYVALGGLVEGFLLLGLPRAQIVATLHSLSISESLKELDG